MPRFFASSAASVFEPLEEYREGIETPSQHELLLALGCELGQGYYFNRPAPAEQIEAALESDLQGQTLVGRSP